jgi:hypothetical protein
LEQKLNSPRNKRSDECNFGGVLDETPTKMVAAPGGPKSYSEERWLLVLLSPKVA